MSFLVKVITNFHLVHVAAKAVGRVVKVILHSNFGLIGLDHVMGWFGLN